MPAGDRGRDLALLRLVAQGVVGPRQGPPERVVRRLVCLQAQDYWSGVASVALRGSSTAEVESAFDDASIVRAWPLRGTLHLVVASDLIWLHELLAPRELAAAAAREARLELTGTVLEKAERIALETLSARGPCSRTEVTAAWRAGGIDILGERGYQLVWHLAHSGTICFGPVRGGQQLLVAAKPWAPGPSGLSREEALEELARRYFDGHGPATAADLSRWAKLTAADTRQAVAAARRHLSAVTLDEVEYLLGPTTEDELAACRRQAEDVVVLPGFDEMIFGYRDRSFTLPDDRAPEVFAHRNGVAYGTVLLAGRVVATWRRPGKHSGRSVEIVPLQTLTARVLRLGQAKASVLL